MALEKELDTYRARLPELLGQGHKGKFVLIHHEEVGGVWPTWEEAAHEGYQRYGVDPFLVKEVTDQERPLYFSRNVTSCQ